MPGEEFTTRHQTIGEAAAWGAFAIGVAYAITLALGLLSLKSAQDPIGDPFFSMLELLIILFAPLIVIVVVMIHAYASVQDKAYSLVALVFIILAAGITSCVHFVILAVSRQIEAIDPSFSLLLSFKWPSVAYALDVLAWDLFFGLSMFFAAPVFRHGNLQTAVRILLIVSGALSIVGLIGVPLADMQIRMIGVVGYAGIPPVIFLLIAIVFRRARHISANTVDSTNP